MRKIVFLLILVTITIPGLAFGGAQQMTVSGVIDETMQEKVKGGEVIVELGGDTSKANVSSDHKSYQATFSLSEEKAAKEGQEVTVTVKKGGTDVWCKTVQLTVGDVGANVVTVNIRPLT